MLKPLTQPRSPASPSFHYAPASQSVPSSPLFRRNSIRSQAQINGQSPTQKVPASTRVPPPPISRVRYADASTQWESPVMNLGKDVADGDSIAAKLGPKTAAVVEVPAAKQPVQKKVEKPSLEPQSPNSKRRQPSAGPSSVGVNSQNIGPKRARPAKTEVKVLPVKYEFCEVEDMVILIANMISELIATNDGLPLRTGVLTRFHSRTPPGISVLDYLQRLAKHATLTPPLLLSMVYYIDRLCSLYPAFTVTTLTIHRFLITAATVAAKGLSDSFWNNATYARVGGIKLAELGLLELDFLYRVDWKIVPNPEVLVDYYRGLVERSEGYELEEEESSSLDDEGDDSGDAETGEGTDPEPREATDVQWKAWMHENSTRKTEVASATKSTVGKEV